jgi:nitrogen fixation/metabolism regulation signal transduction histidine kinase
MKSVKIKIQLLASFGFLAAIVLVMSVLGITSVSSADARFSAYIHGDAKRSDAAASVRILANRRALAVRDLVLVKTAEERAAEQALAGKAHEELQVALGKLEDEVKTDPAVSGDEHALAGEIVKVERAYGPVALSIVQLASTGHRDEAVDKMNDECRPLLTALLKSIATYQEYIRTEGDGKVAAAADANASSRNLLIALTVVSTLMAIGLAIVITHRLVRALGAEPSELASSARSIADGDLSPLHGVQAAASDSVWRPWAPCSRNSSASSARCADRQTASRRPARRSPKATAISPAAPKNRPRRWKRLRRRWKS